MVEHRESEPRKKEVKDNDRSISVKADINEKIGIRLYSVYSQMPASFHVVCCSQEYSIIR